MRVLVGLVIFGVACAAPSAEPTRRAPVAASADPSLVLENAQLPGTTERVRLRIASGVITHIGIDVPAGDQTLDLGGDYLSPQVIDSHVHLAYFPVATELAAGGVAATVDLGAPLGSLGDAGPRSLASGPMLTAPLGYPTSGWGHGGYGLEVASEAAARRAVDQLADAGSALIKVPLPDAGGLGGPVLAAIVERAHGRGLRVVGHALTAADVAEAARRGVDALAHAPIEKLDDAQAAAWRGRAVISTLAAFDPDRAALNLARLREAGALVLYGTDLGNTRSVGISIAEITALESAGLSGSEIAAAMTEAPAAYWGLDVGRLEVGAPACLLATAHDPRERPRTLAAPTWVSACEPAQ